MIYSLTEQTIEFGHSLALEHEHQRQEFPYNKFNPKSCHKYWTDRSEEEILSEIANKDTISRVNIFPFDAASIMMYAMSAECLMPTGGGHALDHDVPDPQTLSTKDKNIITYAYPSQ